MNAAILLLLSVLTPGQMRVEPQHFDSNLDLKTIVVEGVLSSVLGEGEQRQIRLLRCDAKFLLGNLPFDGSKKGNVEIVGDVDVKGKEILVRVKSVTSLPSDLDQYAARAAKAKTFRDWYSLADWSAERADLYNLPEMAKKAIEAYGRAVEVERLAGAGNPEALMTLGKRIHTDQLLTDYDLTDLGHEILLAKQTSLKEPTADQLTELAKEVRTRFALAAAGPIAPLPADVAKAYDAKPLESFRDAASPVRMQMARYLEAKILDQRNQVLFQSGAADARQVALDAEQTMPDYPAMAARWWDRWLQERLVRLPDLSRQEITVLIETISEKAGDQRRAAEALANWLRSREAAYQQREEGAKVRNAIARYQLAMDYLNFADWLAPGLAVAQATRLLEEALKIDPSLKTAADELRELGFQVTDGKWEKPKDERSLTNLESGMLADQVKKLMGEPDQKARLVSSSVVTHQWIYRGIKGNTYVLLEEGRDGHLAVSKVISAR